MGSLFASAAGRISATAPPPEERRQVTVLFYDIVGSTAMLAENDMEEMREKLARVHHAAQQAISDNGGSLEQVLGDGGMAYFGYPKPSEDAALQAVAAAHDLLAARAETAASGEYAPDIRVGIATSVVVLPADGAAVTGGVLGVVGVAPNLAARLQGAAPVNQTLVGRSTYELTRRAYEFHAHGPLELKGFPDVTNAWALQGRRDVVSRFGMTRQAADAMVGREAEQLTLDAALTSAAQGAGSAHLIIGEAGIGKSQLAAAAAARATEAVRIVTLQCNPGAEAAALAPFIATLERAYEQADQDPGLANAAEQAATRLAEIDADQGAGPEQQRRAIVNGAVAAFKGLLDECPLLLIAEDLHWADEVSLAVLTAMAGLAPDASLMILATSRPEGAASPFAGLCAQITLDRLSREAARSLALGLFEEAPGEDLLDRIVAKSDGVPLFISELAAFVRDRNERTEGEADWDQLLGDAGVDSLRDLLSTRLETAGGAKRTAQFASVIGRDFPVRLLARIAEGAIEREQLETDLAMLARNGFLDAGADGEIWTFRHALMREAAYESQLRAVRRRLHASIVDKVLQDPDCAPGATDDWMARQCMEAQRPAEAADYLIRAAETALGRSAITGPRQMLDQALALAAPLEDADLRRILELRAISLLGPLVTFEEGTRKAAALYERGQALCRDLPEGARGDWFPILWGWWFTAPDLIEQTTRSQILMQDVSAEESDEARLQALHCAWACYYDGGRHDESLAAVEEGLALYDEEEGAKSRIRYGHDARVCGLGERAQSLWMLGRGDEGRDAMRAGLAWADETGHAPSICHALDMATLVAFYRRDDAELTHVLDRVEQASAEQDLPVARAKRQVFLGWMQVRRGEDGGELLVREGLEAVERLVTQEDSPIYADIAAEVAALTGASGEALAHLDKAIEDARAQKLLFWSPELLRRRAILTMEAGEGAKIARRLLTEGRALAASQDAKMLVLRNVDTTMTLGLADDLGDPAELRALANAAHDCPERARVLAALDG